MGKTFWVETTYIDATRDMFCGDDDACDTGIPVSEKARLYKMLAKEYGRCVSKMYVDGKDGKAIQTGWVFQGRCKYEDLNETYLREVWVTVLTDKPVKTVKVDRQYFKFKAS
jgi:hypothetical protein